MTEPMVRFQLERSFNGNTAGGDVSLTQITVPDITVKELRCRSRRLGIGVVQSIAETRGKVISEVTGNVFSHANLTVAAGAGLGDESGALKMTADSQSLRRMHHCFDSCQYLKSSRIRIRSKAN